MRYLLPAAGFVSALLFVATGQAAAPARTALPHALAFAQQAHGAPTSAATSTSSGLQWSWVEPTPDGDQLNAIAFGNGTYVAVGTDGVIYTSTNTFFWTVRQSGIPNSESLKDVIFANGQFMATHLGSDGKTDILTSSDGTTWSIQTPSGQSGTAQATQLSYGSGSYVITGVKVLTSSDGKHWSEHSIAGNTRSSSRAAYAGGRFVVLTEDTSGGTDVYNSSDGGSTWNLAATTFAHPADLFYVVANGTSFTLLGTDPGCSGTGSCGLIYTSSDGDTWTAQPDGGNSGGFEAITIWDGSQYLTTSSDPNTGLSNVYTSPDGITWTQGASTNPFNSFDYNSPHQVVFAGGQYVFAGKIALTVLASADYATWNLATTASTPQVDFTDVEYLNGAYYAAGYAPGGPTQILRSTDAKTWIIAMFNPSHSAFVGVDTLAYGNKIYVALGDVDQAFTSSDGLTWTANPKRPTGEFSQVVYGAGKFVAVGAGCASGCPATIATSTDGKTWTEQSPGSNYAPLQAVAYDGKRFVAVGSGVASNVFGVGGDAVSMTSSDGVNWSVNKIAPPSGFTFTHLRAIDGKYYAVGYEPSFFDGYLAVSTDGLHWTDTDPVINGRAPAVSDIGWVNGSYYMISQGFGEVITSTDASHWSDSGNGLSTAYLQALTVQGQGIVAVGSLDGVGGTTGAIVVGRGAPVASDGALDTTEDTAAKATLAGSVAPGDTAAFSVVAKPAHGTVKLTNTKTGAFTYTPATGYAGKDSFTFTLSDGSQQSAAATESITVKASSGGGSGGGSSGGGELGILTLVGLASAVRLRRR